MADFWSIVVGIVGTAVVLGGTYGLIELSDAFQNARYHRAQRDGGSGFVHNGANTDA